MFTTNGKPINARSHIANDQVWSERNNIESNYAVRPDYRHVGPNQGHQSTFSRFGPTCFGRMIRGKKYPAGFKRPS
jgi:hypothetical protein